MPGKITIELQEQLMHFKMIYFILTLFNVFCLLIRNGC